MQESNDTPSRSVDAAVAFSKAIKYYEKAGDVDTVCDLEANIFWCKKRMDVNDVKAFVAQKNGDQGVKDALAKADAVATKVVPKEEAQNYFGRAEKFSKEHPDDLDGIIAHYIEVAERFTGSDIAIKAQKLSIEAQNRQRAQYKAQQEAQRETLFTRSSAAAAAAGHQAAVPDATALRAAVATVRKLYKDQYAKSKPAQKRHLAIKLLREAPASKDDPVTQYALLSESIDLSMAASDWYATFTACDVMAQCFTGVDAKAKKKDVFAKARNNPTVQAILKLLDSPEDADANAVAGRYFCFEGGNWAIGLPLLAHGGDADLKAVAGMEILKPAGTAEQIELGDKWYALGKKAKQPAQDGMLTRAVYWYKRAEPGLAGVTKDRIGQRLDELYRQIPEPGLDYAHLTAKQWERMPSKAIDINAASQTNDIGLTLTAGTRVIIVPHPTETWTMHYEAWHWPGAEANVFDTDATGTIPKERGHRYMDDGPLGIIGMMLVTVGGSKPVKPGEIEGDGKVFIGPNTPTQGKGNATGSGKIRIKIVMVDEDAEEHPEPAAPPAGASDHATSELRQQLASGNWVDLVPKEGLPGWENLGGTWRCEGTSIMGEGGVEMTRLLLGPILTNFEFKCVMTCLNGAAGPGRSEPLTRNVGIEWGYHDGQGHQVLARYGYTAWCVEDNFDAQRRHAVASIPAGPLRVLVQVWQGHLRVYHEGHLVAEDTLDATPGRIGLCCYYKVAGAKMSYTDMHLRILTKAPDPAAP